jgi:hypothetical protein
MPLKRKATSPLLSGKQVKKGNQSEKVHHPAVTDDEGVEQPKTGKIIENKQNEGKGFMTFKGKIESPDLMDKNHDMKEADHPNIELNHLLQ